MGISPVDHDPMVRARHYRDELDALIKRIEEADISDEDEQLVNREKVLDVLRYAHLELSDRYRNFVHVYAIAQKGTGAKPKTTRKKRAK